jgi:hypothetical protein
VLRILGCFLSSDGCDIRCQHRRGPGQFCARDSSGSGANPETCRRARTWRARGPRANTPARAQSMWGARHPLFGYLTARSQPSADRPDLRAADGPSCASRRVERRECAHPLPAHRRRSVTTVSHRADARGRNGSFSDSCGDRHQSAKLWGFCGAPGRTQMTRPSHRPDSHRDVNRLGTR